MTRAEKLLGCCLMNKKKNINVCNGISTVAHKDREKDDYYATEPKATRLLMELETFSKSVWECACGEGHMSEVLKEHGYMVFSSDIVDRGYEDSVTIDFLNADRKNHMDIITNPPYKLAKEFVEHALDISDNGVKVAMFLKLTFLESQSRRALFEKYPPKKVYVSSNRLLCAKSGDFEKHKNEKAIAYCWFVWEKGYTGDTVVKWFN